MRQSLDVWTGVLSSERDEQGLTDSVGVSHQSEPPTPDLEDESYQI